MVNMTKEDISQMLKLIESESGLSKSKLAKKLGVDKKTIIRWENGESFPDSYNLDVIKENFPEQYEKIEKEAEFKQNKPNNNNLIIVALGPILLAFVLSLSGLFHNDYSMSCIATVILLASVGALTATHSYFRAPRIAIMCALCVALNVANLLM